MNNSVTVSVEFFFKGEKYSPSLVLDLDVYTYSEDGLSALYSTIAKKNDIDLYSYEYEIMQSVDFTYSDATGLAENFLVDGQFDFVGFERAREEAYITGTLAVIARDTMAIDDLSSHPDLKAALLQAYNLGKDSA